MPQEIWIPFEDTMLFQLARLGISDTLIIFFHGLGDSHLSFKDFFETPWLKDYDLCINDLLGHGRSGQAPDYTFSYQTRALSHTIARYVGKYKKIILVPHSMGGIHTTLLAQQHPHAFHGIFAVETPLTQHYSFIAETVYQNQQNGVVYEDWFKQFQEKIYHRGIKNKIYRNYFAGLTLVREKAFLQNALEICEQITNNVGERFIHLPLSKWYCMGGACAKTPNLTFLSENKIQYTVFNTNSHWVAQARPKAFCQLLRQFILSSVDKTD